MKTIVAFFAAVIGGVAAVMAAIRLLIRRREVIDWSDARGPGKVIDVDGVAIHYVERAPPGRSRDEVPTIVMIHGFGGHTFSFRHQLSEFGDEYRCVAIDLKGFGYSARPKGGDYSLTEQARLMLRTMDLLDIDRAVLIGHSMGGEVAMRIAATAPERVEKLILAASVSGERAPMAPRVGIFRPLMPAASRIVGVSAWRRMFYDRSEARPEGDPRRLPRPRTHPRLDEHHLGDVGRRPPRQADRLPGDHRPRPHPLGGTRAHRALAEPDPLASPQGVPAAPKW